MSEIQFSHQGVSSLKELKPEAPVVYESRTSIRKKCTKPSRLQPDEFGSGWQGFDGKIVFGTPKKNRFHLYTPDTAYVDGVNRICYVQMMPNCLLISEFGGSRGANYSGMYRILRQLLLENQFEEQDRAFEIPKTKQTLFIEVLNQVIQNKANSLYHLEAVSETDSIYTDQERRYFYKAYWTVSTPEPAPVLESPVPSAQTAMIDSLTQAEQMICQTVNAGLECRQIEDLKAAEQKIKSIRSLLDRYSEFLSTYINALQKAKQISDGEFLHDEETQA